jgi:hypothetical protein
MTVAWFSIVVTQGDSFRLTEATSGKGVTPLS